LAADWVVTVRVTGKDRYGRTLGTIILPDGKNVNEEIGRAGFAWHYKKYSKHAAFGGHWRSKPVPRSEACGPTRIRYHRGSGDVGNDN
jgi:endonuclease YncB( thermonuclease family)